MFRAMSLALILNFLGGAMAVAQDTAWQFRWRKGQTLAYRVNHVTNVTETIGGGKNETTSKLTLVKHWKVVDVDAAGVATLQLSLASLRNEQVRPNGEKMLFDSTDLEGGTPELRGLKQHIGATLAVIRIDGHGRTLEVKQGSAAKYEAEPPFALVLPATAPQEGQTWLRQYQVVLEPPQGTGEKHAAEQKYACAKLADGLATLTIATEFKNMPENMAERLPLLQKEAQGQAIFDVNAGRLRSVRLTTNKTIENHQGAGSSYQFVSTYVEELAETP